MKPFSATAPSRPPWQDPRRRRQVVTGIGALLGLYFVLVFIAFLGGPRIGASFLPLPGGGPDPASPVAGLEPSQPTQNVPAIPRGTTPAPGTTPTASPTILPTATIPSAGATTAPIEPPGTTSWLRPTPGNPTTQIVDQFVPTTTPVTTKAPPTRTTTAPPPTRSTSAPTSNPTAPPPTSTTPSTPPTTPEDPDPPQTPSLGGLLGSLLDKLGL